MLGSAGEVDDDVAEGADADAGLGKVLKEFEVSWFCGDDSDLFAGGSVVPGELVPQFGARLVGGRWSGRVVAAAIEQGVGVGEESEGSGADLMMSGSGPVVAVDRGVMDGLERLKRVRA